jgi:nucleoside-diphosphate-sugar epimerase
MARCLVTGHKGYIGSRLFNKLKDLGHKVIGIDLLDSNNKNDLIDVLAEDTDGRFHPYYYNFKPEYIFHLACWPRVGYSVENPVETARNNILAGTIILNFARKVGSVKRLIYSSSSSVVGNGNGPASPYALQKYATELETSMYPVLYGLDTVSLRYFNVYSPCQEASGPYATAVANWMKFIREGRDPFITGDGEQRRDMSNLEDVVDANIFCMNYENNMNGDVFDVGTGTNISLNEMKDIVLKYFPKINFNYKDDRPGDVMFTKANMDKFKKIGWSPSVNIEKGIHSCFNNLKKELGYE